MMVSMRTGRRAVAGALGAGAFAGAMLFGAIPSAMADDPALNPPNCTAADLAFTAAGVSQATSDYLFSHQDVNYFFTSLEGKTRDEVRTEVDQYMSANPIIKGELTGIRQPLVDIKNRCGDSNGDGIADTP